jgi:predicted metal-dependent RNase
VIKQVCHIEKFQVRRSKLILNHIFSALMAYVEIQKNQFERIFENIYRWQKKLFRPMIKNEIHARVAILNKFTELGRPHTQVAT